MYVRDPKKREGERNEGHPHAHSPVSSNLYPDNFPVVRLFACLAVIAIPVSFRDVNVQAFPMKSSRTRITAQKAASCKNENAGTQNYKAAFKDPAKTDFAQLLTNYFSLSQGPSNLISYSERLSYKSIPFPIFLNHTPEGLLDSQQINMRSYWQNQVRANL